MLAYNVAGLMGSVPGTDRRYHVSDESIDLPDDLHLARPIDGDVRLSRTDRSVIAEAHLRTALEETCSRCLGPAEAPIDVDLLEEALPSIDFQTGVPLDLTAEPDALRIDDHHILDLEPPVRDAISMAEPIAPLCRTDCRGLCPECGINLNEQPDHDHGPEPVDPRLALLADWRPADDSDVAGSAPVPSKPRPQRRAREN